MVSCIVGYGHRLAHAVCGYKQNFFVTSAILRTKDVYGHVKLTDLDYMKLFMFTERPLSHYGFIIYQRCACKYSITVVYN